MHFTIKSLSHLQKKVLLRQQGSPPCALDVERGLVLFVHSYSYATQSQNKQCNTVGGTVHQTCSNGQKKLSVIAQYSKMDVRIKFDTFKNHIDSNDLIYPSNRSGTMTTKV